jgi:2-polyprenyl-6-methoxyphenol hydroxylase-like FAD-dependent oxidoreductase
VTTPDGAESIVHLRQDGEDGLGLPRRELEELLLDAVRRAGGRVESGARVRGFARVGGRWRVDASGPAGPAAFDSDFLALADGRFSLARRDAAKPAHGWFGWNALFENVRQDAGRMSLHFHPGGYVGVLTFANGTSNVCGLTYRSARDSKDWETVFQAALARQRFLRDIVGGARRTGDWQGVGPLPFTASRRPSSGPLLVGDAAAVGDPFMGEGLGRALGAGAAVRDALGEAPAAVDETALRERYAALWDRRYRARLRLGVVTRQALRRPALFRALFVPLAGRPRWIERLTPLFHRAA